MLELMGYPLCTYSMHGAMQAQVHRCRREGVALAREEIARNYVRGELGVRRRGYHGRMAQLLAADGERSLLPVLDKARILAIDHRGILLGGWEVFPPRGSKGAGTRFPQTWWCILQPSGDAGRAPARADFVDKIEVASMD